MTPERWQRIKEIFNSAIKREPEQRSSFLSEACLGDSDLRSEVESLVASYEKDGSFIDSPAYRAMAELFESERAELQPGQVVGSYKISSFINRGGMGEVYLAHDARLQRKVALKLLPSSVMKDTSRLRRFEQEARAASALNHPNIITIYEVREADSMLMIATEFVEGETLRHRLSFGALPLNTTLHIVIQVTDALSAAHRAGIVHRDIKPENIMIRPDGYAKVLDFGLAKLTEHASPLPLAEAPTRNVMTGSGGIIGTVGYMSPEQARGQRVDARSDIFNVGTLIYEMVSGQKPFDGETTSDVFAAILKTEPVPLSQLVPTTPVELVRIVTKALKKDREERYQVVKDLLLDLKTLKEDLDFQEKLDRSVAPSKAGDTQNKGTGELEAAGTAPSETVEIKTAVSTITQSLSAEIRRHKTAAIIMSTAIAVLVAVAIFGVYKLLNRTHSGTTEGQQILSNTQITFSPGLDGFPAISPDGKSIAYSSDQNGSLELYVKQLGGGGGELQLTNDGKQNLHPAWSPDGQRIAYYSKNRSGIWIVSALGGTPKQLTEFGARPSWSRDGSQIAFQSNASAEVFNSSALAPSTIWTVPLQGGAPFFSADGRHLYLLGERQPGLFQIELSADGDPIGEPSIVLSPGSGSAIRTAAISLDGKKIAYSGSRTMSNLWAVSMSKSTAEATGPPSAFTRDTSLRNNLVRFSPDGRKLALTRWRPGTSADIWVADADGRNLTQLTNNTATDSQASWFPSNDKIAFLSDRDNNERRFALWSISLTTGKEEHLMDMGIGAQFVALSPDGSQAAFNADEKGVINLWVASLKDGQRKQLTFDDHLMGFPCWSRDGRWIAFENQVGEEAQLMIIPSSGGQITQLTFDHGKHWPNDWSPDGDKITFAGQRDGVWNIYWVSLSTKEQKQLTNYSKLNAFVRYPAWSPLGDKIVYEYAEWSSNIWLVELK